MTHACPVSNCKTNVPAHMYMCARHWRMVPKPLQTAVYESYRSSGRLSENHREAVRVVNLAEKGQVAAPDLPAGMKALTIWQPWASLVMIGAKPWEFRKWSFTDKPNLAKLVGQRIVIHAGARPIRLSELTGLIAQIEEGESSLVTSIALPFVQRLRTALASKAAGADEIAPLAVALGTAVIGRPQKSFDLFKHVVADSDRLDHQMYAWPLSDHKLFPAPIPTAGVQGFWNFT